LDSSKEVRGPVQATPPKGDYGGASDVDAFGDNADLDSEDDDFEEDDVDYEEDAMSDLDTDEFTLPEDILDVELERVPAARRNFLDDDAGIDDSDALADLVDQADEDGLADEDDEFAHEDTDDDTDVSDDEFDYGDEGEEEDVEGLEDEDETVRDQILDDESADDETEERVSELLERYVGEDAQREFDQRLQADSAQYEELKQAARKRIDAARGLANAQAGPVPPGAEGDTGSNGSSTWREKKDDAKEQVVDIDALIENSPQDSAS
jgi:hypothetical protein